MKNVHFVVGSVRIELDLRPPNSHRYPDEVAMHLCKQIADDIAKALNANKVDIQFSLSEHGFPRMADNSPVQ